MIYLRSILVWAWIVVVTFFICFSIFIFYPVCLILNPSRSGLHFFSRLWARLIIKFSPFLDIEVFGQENLEAGKTYVFISNHQSLGDIPSALFIKQHFKFVAKKKLFEIPIFGWAMGLVGYIPLIRGDGKSGFDCIEKARAYLKQGISILFFPEGTRSLDESIQSFKSGAFRLAAQEKIPMIPVVILGTRNILSKHSWLFKKANIVVSIGKPFEVSAEDAGTLTRIKQTVREEMMGRYQELSPLTQRSS